MRSGRDVTFGPAERSLFNVPCKRDAPRRAICLRFFEIGPHPALPRSEKVLVLQLEPKDVGLMTAQIGEGLDHGPAEIAAAANLAFGSRKDVLRVDGREHTRVGAALSSQSAPAGS